MEGDVINIEGDNVQINEGQALSDIVTWSEGLFAWQRDALRRLCQSSKLTKQDIEDLIKICKSATNKAQPISHLHVSNPVAHTKKVSIKSIDKVKNVNALATDQKLQFCANGITVVYGDNGSGKSGYTRILKQICRARDPKSATILSNIYATPTKSMKARISFAVAEQNQIFDWIKDKTIEPLLSLVSVFDSSTANIHVDGTNDVAYIPFPMKLLSNLADACGSIKHGLQDEINTLLAQTPDSVKSPKCQPDTAVGKVIADLKLNIDPQIIEVLATLSDDDENRLRQLQSDLAIEPAVLISILNDKLKHINEVCKKATQLSSAISAEQRGKLMGLQNENVTRKKAANLAATALFKNDPLPKVGGATWESLWESARRYSQDGAYVGKVFPVTNDGSHCVLCQQVLDADAKKRLERFETFITDDTKQQEQMALNNLLEFRGRLSAMSPSITEIRKIVSFFNHELKNVNLAKEIRTFFIKGKWRLRSLLNQQGSLPVVYAWPKVEFDAEKTRISKHLSDFTAGDTVSARNKLIFEKTELVDKKWLSVVKTDVLAEIDRINTIDHLSKLIKKQTATAQITAKSTNISKSLVTNALIEQFTQEVNKMQLAGLAVELKHEGSRSGEPQFKVSLTGSRLNTKVGNILSEGEFRCIALATFLAELATTQSKSAIVFDDPVSSLDHMHREALAKRLAEEALTRQVIVFTHDIYFLFLLGEFCQDNNAKIQYRHVTKRPDTLETGICHLNAPPKAQDVKNCIESLQNRLDNEKIHCQMGDQNRWEKTMRSLYLDIRTTWERAVEDLVGVVVTRFSNKVNTNGLKRLTVLTENNCQEMRDAYGRCSRWAHSSGVGNNPNLPDDKDIQKEITVLKTWYTSIRNKQRAIK